MGGGARIRGELLELSGPESQRSQPGDPGVSRERAGRQRPVRPANPRMRPTAFRAGASRSTPATSPAYLNLGDVRLLRRATWPAQLAALGAG